MTITSIILIIIAAVVEGIIRIVKFSRKKAKEALELRKSEFPKDVRHLICYHMFDSVIRSEAELMEGALYSTDKILKSLGLEAIFYRKSEEILKIVTSVKPPMYVLRVLEANLDLINKIKGKKEERKVIIDSVFEKVFPSINFEEWDKIALRKQSILIRDIIEGMETRGELKPMDKISASEENLVNP